MVANEINAIMKQCLIYWSENAWCPSQESASLTINWEIRAFCFLRKEPQGTLLAQIY
jgi:hypothetical protein